MEWYSNFNYSNIGNGSVLLETKIGAWPHFSLNHGFDGASLFKANSPPDLMSGIFYEISKSSIIALLSLAGVTKMKPTSFRSNVFSLLEVVFVLVIAIIVYALLAVFLAPFVLYRLAVYIYYKICKPTCTLMHGPDTFWSMDTDEARAIINTLLLLEIKDSGDYLLENLTEQMKKLCSDPVYGYKFMSYTKKSNFGYYYWEKGDINEVKNHLKYIETPITTEDDLKQYLSTISNKYIEGFKWEVYVSKQNLENSELRPVIFRLYHSIGDGASILQALMNSIMDKTHSGISLNQNLNASFQTKGANFRYTVPKSEPYTIKKNKFVNLLKINLSAIPALVYGPFNVIKQMLEKKENFNLAVEQLSGNKLLTWHNSTDMLNNIKTIRRKTNSSFSVVVFGLISNSIEKYLEKSDKNRLPKFINVVVPVMGNPINLRTRSEIIRECNNIKVTKISEFDKGMTNSFWVAMLQLPLFVYHTSKVLKNKINIVKEYTDKLSKSPDFMMYRLTLNIVLTTVPGEFVKPIFNVVKHHMAFSNLPGPQNEVVISGNKVKEMTFWLPNVGTTGLGFSLISNNNRLSIALIADTAVIPTQQDLQSILDDFIDSAKKESS